MAAYIVSLVVNNITSRLIDKVLSYSIVSGSVERIERELRRIQCFLEDADAKQDGDERISNWVADI